jgi:hypothetical protein
MVAVVLPANSDEVMALSRRVDCAELTRAGEFVNGRRRNQSSEQRSKQQRNVMRVSERMQLKN